MAKKRPIQKDQIDFDTGGQTNQDVASFETVQRRLFSVSNPYVGNKRNIIVPISQALKSEGIDYTTVLDLFGGSGVVSLFMKLMGKRVVYNDLLTSSYYNAVAFVQNNEYRLEKSDIDYLCHNKNPSQVPFCLERYHGRFTPEECVFLDNYRANIDSLTCSGESRLTKRALAFVAIEHYVMERCFIGGRLNKGQVIASLEHRLEHSRNGGDTMKFRLKAPPFFPDGSVGNLAFNMDAESFLARSQTLELAPMPDFDLVYVDPPYGSSQSDYAQMFSFCEEYIFRQPIDKIPHVVAASKKFTQSKSYEENFRRLLTGLQSIPVWAVSYSEASFGDCDTIRNILLEHKKRVKVVNIAHEYRYRKDRSSAVKEFLFICR